VNINKNNENINKNNENINKNNENINKNNENGPSELGLFQNKQCAVNDWLEGMQSRDF
jgi:hypothetical protein